MTGEKFTLMQYSVSAILGLIDAEDFVIPEIQRPFVWKRSQVRDLIDSLYNGYPTGYIITWKNPDVKTKDGGKANGKKVLIDGQQRVTALMAAIAGKEVLDDDFNKDRIKIAFNPLAEDETKCFAVQDASHLKDKRWIPDISVVFDTEFDSFDFAMKYCEVNEGIKPNEVNKAVTALKGIANRQIGVIELDAALDIDEVTEIFIRINSKGTALSQSDFVMSKMAADTIHAGSLMRKTVDYFCHLAVKPDFYSQLTHDAEFQASKYADKIKWLAKDYDDIYDPDYGDMLRVSFMHQFRRGKLADLVSLLSGRDFVTKEFREDIVEESYGKLDSGIMNFINQYNFSQFVMAIKGAGYVSSKAYVEKISAKEDDAETPTSDVLPYLLKSHVVRYGSKAKQSIMNQLNELICNYPNKDRTIIAYFLSSILNHIGKNKDKCTIFKNDVKGSTVFSFLDLTFYAYSFFPNYGNTQKLLQIISYVRDEYDIFEESTRLQALINKYAFIFDKANINDVVNLFLFCRQAKIEIPYLQEECIVRKIKEKDDPILWATYLMYSQYNRKYSDEIRSCIEKTLLEKINAIRVQKSVYEYREFWWILIFNKCPFITNASQNAIDNAITLLNVPTASGCTHTLVDIFKNYLQNSPIQFFDWDIERNDFLRTLTFKTHEKSIFKNYKENAISLAWGSI